MAQLISCFECGKSVSSGASQCPHCRTSSIRGVDCIFCGMKLKSSQSVSLPNYKYGKGAHNECVQRVIIEPEPVEVRCSVCSYPTTYNCKKIRYGGREEVKWSGYDICSNCGDKVSLSHEIREDYKDCYHCGLLLKKSNSVQVSRLYYVHDFCYTCNEKFQNKRSEYITLTSEIEKMQAKVDELYSRKRNLKRLEDLFNILFDSPGNYLSLCILGALLFVLKIDLANIIVILVAVLCTSFLSMTFIYGGRENIEKQLERLKEEIKTKSERM